jgi:phospholipase/carboxylesterase
MTPILRRIARREGERPRTSVSVPHQQLSQNAPLRLQVALSARCSQLQSVEVGASCVSVPGAIGLYVAGCGRSIEFAHVHPSYDGSLHVRLTPESSAQVVAAEWGEPHPAAGAGVPVGTTLVYGPRSLDEVSVCYEIVRAGHSFCHARVLRNE